MTGNQIRDSFKQTAAVFDWISQMNREIKVNIERIPFRQLSQWRFEKGRIFHTSGKFFSIEGLSVVSEFEKRSWTQPIIIQPEIGILGILARKIDGVYYFLLQAKVEPGNLNNVQLSPTVQATRSNYTQVHGGKRPLYLEYFLDRAPGRKKLVDQIQSEQGSRFLKKRNRNMVIEITEEVPLADNFCWLTLGQIKELMRHDNVVNMDTRTVISGLPLFSDHRDAVGDIFSWIADFKASCSFERKLIPLDNMANWVIGDDEIYEEQRKFFSVIAVQVSINNREVTTWDQPIVKPAAQGVAAVFLKKNGAETALLLQMKPECGNLDTFELGPTIQYTNGSPDPQDMLYAYFSKLPKSAFIYDVMQSEEGGRFYKEQNRNVIVALPGDLPFDLPPHYRWISLGQIQELLRMNNVINIELRSLIAALYPEDPA